MIGLQAALVIAGVVVFIVVAVVSYDRYRRAKMGRRESDREDLDSILHPRRDPRAGIFERAPEPEPETGERMEPKLELQRDTAGEEGAEERPDQSRAADRRSHGVQQQSLPLGPRAEAAGRRESGRSEREVGGRDTASAPPTADTEDKLPIELVARIPGDNVIKRDTALGIYRQFEFDMKKRHRIFGLLHPDKVWRDMEKQPETSQFTDFGVSVQLADRHGAITESELNHFSQMVLRFAEIFGRRFRFSISLNDALEYAHRLDEFCNKYDAVAILNVIARDRHFRGEEVHRCAREMGLLLNQRSIYEKREPNVQGGELVYSMASLQNNGELPAAGHEAFTTGGITLFMNIPRAENPPQVFGHMVNDAKEICKRLDGKLVDQNLRGMTQKGLKRISQHIRQIVHEMELEGISPGSEKALRLF